MPPQGSENSIGEFVKNGDTVSLFHEETERYLYSSKEFRSPTSHQQEVACVEQTKRSAETEWIIKLKGKEYFELYGEFSLIHKPTKCYLRSHKVSFYINNFETQQEVACFSPTGDNSHIFVSFLGFLQIPKN